MLLCMSFDHHIRNCKLGCVCLSTWVSVLYYNKNVRPLGIGIGPNATLLVRIDPSHEKLGRSGA